MGGSHLQWSNERGTWRGGKLNGIRGPARVSSLGSDDWIFETYLESLLPNEHKVLVGAGLDVGEKS